jgi:Ser/Thr protein kinase RdoA (MazF antagonist)
MNISLSKKQISDELSKINIHLNQIESFSEGTSKSTYKIKTKEDTMILKLFSNSDYNTIKDKINLLHKISKHYKHVVLPTNCEPLIIQGVPSYIYKYFNGEIFSKIKIKNKSFEFGKIVAEFDIALQKIPLNQSVVSDADLLFLPNQKYSDLEISKLTNMAIGMFKTEISNIDLSKIRKQYIHKDLHYHNVVYNPANREHLIVDMDGISVQYLPREIAVSIGNLLLNPSNNFSKINVLNLMQGYSSILALNDEEKKSIPLFIIQKKLGEIDYLHTQLSEINKENIEEIKSINNYIELSQKALKYTLENYDILVDFFLKNDFKLLKK